MASARAMLNSPMSTTRKSYNITTHWYRTLIKPAASISVPLRRFRSYCNRSTAASIESATACSRARQYDDEIRSHHLVDLEYADLNLSDKFCQEVGHVRIRQHVNPLRSSMMISAEVPDWNKVFKDATLPLMVDIGSVTLSPPQTVGILPNYPGTVAQTISLSYISENNVLLPSIIKGSGRFLLWLAKRNANCRNYLGMEIRPKLVKRARYWVDELALSNIHFIYANAMVSFKQLVTTYPGPLKLVSILCPDPHFKKKHHKRRVVQKPLVDSIVDCLMPRGQVFIQSDIFDVALDMRNRFDAEEEKLVHINNIDSTVLCDDEGWLLNTPLGIRTEREIHAENEGARIYRRMYQKVSTILPN